MRLDRPLRIFELEQRIVPAYTFYLDSVVAADHGLTFTYTDADGDTVEATRDATTPLGSIAITDTSVTAVDASTFHKIDSAVFDAACDATTTFAVKVTGSTATSNGITTVGYINFTAPAAIKSIEIEGDVIGATGQDSVSGSTLDSLNVHSAQSGDGATDIANSAIGGDIIAASSHTGIVLVSGLAGTIHLDHSLSGGTEIGISIKGAITGDIEVGGMTNKVIRQIDNGGNEGVTGATIDITGNLGGIWTDGTVSGTDITVTGNFDASSLTKRDAIATDLDDNGIGTINNGSALITVGGNLLGNISNNDNLTGNKWPVLALVGDFEDMALDIFVSGQFGSSVISGGSLTGTLTADPAAAAGLGVFNGNVLAFHDITNLTIDARSFGTSIVAADAEAEADALYSLPASFDAVKAAGLHDGGISGLAVTSTTSLTGTFSNTLAETGLGNDDVSLTLDSGTTMNATVSSARNLDFEATAGTTFTGTLSSLADADVAITSGTTMNATVTTSQNLDFDATAGTSFTGNLTTTADANVTITSGTTMTANVTSGHDLVLDANAGTSFTGTLSVFADADVTVTAGTSIGGTVTVGEDLHMVDVAGTTYSGTVDVTIDADVSITAATGITATNWTVDRFLTLDAMTGDSFSGTMTVGLDADVSIHSHWINADLLANRDIDADIMAEGGPAPSISSNSINLYADHDNNGTGILSGTIVSFLGLDSGSQLRGEAISASLTIERFPGAFGSDTDMDGPILAGAGGISGDVSIDGSLMGRIVSGGSVTGDIVIGGNLLAAISIDGNAHLIDIGGDVVNLTPPVVDEINVTGYLDKLHVGGDVGPGIGPADTVFIHAANFGTIMIDGNVKDFVDILAGAEPGTGTIDTFFAGGTVVPTHLLADGTSINQIRATIHYPGYEELATLGGGTVKYDLADSLGGGVLKITVANGSVNFLYDDTAGLVDELVGIVVTGGTPNVTMRLIGNHGVSIPSLGFVSAPTFEAQGSPDPLDRSVGTLSFKNVNVDDIDISGNATSIRLKNGNLGDCTIGDPSDPESFDVGYLGSLVLQGKVSKGTGQLTGDLSVLRSLWQRLDAVDITGSVTIGGDAGTILVRHDLDAPISVNGNAFAISAIHDTDGIEDPIHIGGDLINFKANRAPFMGSVEIQGSLKGTFDVLGGANSDTRTVEFDPVADITTAHYETGGTLIVHSQVKGGKIK